MSEEPTVADNSVPQPKANINLTSQAPQTVVLPSSVESEKVESAPAAPSFTLPKAETISQAPKATFELPKSGATVNAIPRAVPAMKAPIPPQTMNFATSSSDTPSTLSVGLDFLAAAVAVAFAVLIILDI